MFQERQIAGALPRGSFLFDYVRFAAACTDAHLAYHVGAALALLTQTFPVKGKIPFGAETFGNLYILLVGDSTETRKTEAIKIARMVVRESVPHMIMAAPGSWEGLVDELALHPWRSIFYEEFGGFLSTTQRGYANPIKTILTQAYDGSPVGRHTVSGKKAGKEPEVPSPRLTILGGCSPPYLEEHTDKADWMGGFMARFLTIMASREREYWPAPTPDLAVLRALAERMQKYFTSATYVGNGVQQCGGLSPQAQALGNEWRLNYGQRKRNLPEIVRGGAGRADAMAIKIATLVEWDINEGARAGIPWTISAQALEFAYLIVDLHLKSLAQIAEWIAPNQTALILRQVLSTIPEDGTPRTLGEILWGAKLVKRVALEMLEALMEAGKIERVNGELTEPVRYRQPVAKVIPFPGTGARPSQEDDREE